MLQRFFSVAVAFALLSACADTPVTPEAAAPAPALEAGLDFENSGNPNAAFLVRVDGVCGVFLDDQQSDISNFDAKFYQTTTSSGVVNLNCTGATLRPDQIPERTYVFKWAFGGLSCTNRITSSGTAHSNCHGKQ